MSLGQARLWHRGEIEEIVKELFASPDFAEAVRRVRREGEETEAPPVEDKLARAEKCHEKVIEIFNRKNRFEWDKEAESIYDNALYAIRDLKAAIRERDEKASQMMTVEEVMEWRKTWGAELLSDHLRRRIKERNEEKK